MVYSKQSGNNDLNRTILIGIENWLLIILFIVFLRTIQEGWIAYGVCAFLVGVANFVILIFDPLLYSKKTKKFLLYRIGWSISCSIIIFLIYEQILHNFELLLVLTFYLLALFDILINISSRTITLEIGPGFIPKLLR